MKEPKNTAEKKLFKEMCIASYKQEMVEISTMYNNVEDIYYSEHRGTWILTYKNELKDDEFDSKEDLMEFLETEGND